MMYFRVFMLVVAVFCTCVCVAAEHSDTTKPQQQEDMHAFCGAAELYIEPLPDLLLVMKDLTLPLGERLYTAMILVASLARNQLDLSIQLIACELRQIAQDGEDLMKQEPYEYHSHRY